MKRSSAFYINGGAGRVVCSIPAFEKFQQENPDDDFIIVCEGGMDFFKGHPTLHDRAYDVWHKGLFEQFIKDRNCFTPEPYRIWEYYNQKCGLAQAFDIAINNKGIRELPPPSINLNKMEMIEGAKVVDEVKRVTGFDKVLVVQPFGRGIISTESYVIDPSSRSFQLNNIIEIINTLKKEYAIIIMSEIPIDLEDKDNGKYPVGSPQIQDMRIWAGILQIADHFLGCDSLGQHIVKALGKTATVVIGSTFPINISYPNDPDFDIIDVGEGKRVYSPIRTTMEEQQDRYNDEAMELNDKQKNEILSSVRKRLGKSNRVAPRATPPDFNKPPMEFSPTALQDCKPQILIPGSSAIK